MCGENLKCHWHEVWIEKVWNSSHAKGKVLAGPDNPERSKESIRRLEKAYKYLGLEQLFDENDSKVKACLINELTRRLHKVWGSHLNGKNAAEASNMLYASLMTLRYMLEGLINSGKPWNVWRKPQMPLA